jgi:hypothetical protein
MFDVTTRQLTIWGFLTSQCDFEMTISVVEPESNDVSRVVPSLSQKELLDKAGVQMVQIDSLPLGILVLKCKVQKIWHTPTSFVNCFGIHFVAFHWSISILRTAVVSFGEVKRVTWPHFLYCHLANVCVKCTLCGQNLRHWIDLTACSHMYTDSGNCLWFSGCFLRSEN